jgi:hypothetical protein
MVGKLFTRTAESKARSLKQRSGKYPNRIRRHRRGPSAGPSGTGDDLGDDAGFKGLTKITEPENSSAGRPEGGPGGSGGQDLVEEGLGLVLVGVLGQRQLRHQDLSRLGQHALLTCGKATVLVAAPEVANDLGHPDDVA